MKVVFNKLFHCYGNLPVLCHEDNQNLFTKDMAFMWYQHYNITW